MIQQACDKASSFGRAVLGFREHRTRVARLGGCLVTSRPNLRNCSGPAPVAALDGGPSQRASFSGWCNEPAVRVRRASREAGLCFYVAHSLHTRTCSAVVIYWTCSVPFGIRKRSRSSTSQQHGGIQGAPNTPKIAPSFVDSRFAMETVRVADLCVGVLELHGDFAEHSSMLAACGVQKIVSLRQASHVTSELDAVVFPGGESTVMGKLLVELDMLKPIQQLASDGVPMFGTCAGCIVLASRLPGYEKQPRIGAMDVAVDRNAYGSQIDSFEASVRATDGVFEDGKPLRVVHIRAPAFVDVGPSAQVLAEHAGKPILVRQGQMLSCTFHPELTEDTRIHEYFLDMVCKHKASALKGVR